MSIPHTPVDLVNKYDFETSPLKNGKGNKPSISWPENLMAKGIESYRGAEMHFLIAPEIVSAFKLRAEGTFGYTHPDDVYFDAVIDWVKERRGCSIPREAVYPYYGTMQAIITAFRAFSQAGDGVIMPSPSYQMHNFLISQNHRKQVTVPLIFQGDTYHFDIAAMRAAMSDPINRILLLCQPNNPTGTIWARDELAELAQIARKTGILILSDEIFGELTFPGYIASPFVDCCEENDRVISIISLGKSFNLIGQPNSNVLIRDKDTRERFIEQAEIEMMRNMDAFIHTAVVTAYTQCGGWLDEVRQLMLDHYQIWKTFLEEHLPQVKIIPPQGTYLLWIDWRDLGMDDDDLEDFLFNDADIAVDRGDVYGPGGSGFTRTNIAMPTRDLEAMLSRLLLAARRRGYAR